MALELGTVTGYNRRVGKALVLLDGREQSVPCSYLNQEPPPRARVWVEQVQNADSQWLVVGSQTPYRLLLRDDFQTLGQGTIGLVPSIFGDTIWPYQAAGAAPAFTLNSAVSGGYSQRSGQVAISTDTGVFNWTTISKSLASGQTMWLGFTGALWQHFIIAANEVSGNVVNCGYGDHTIAQRFGAAASPNRGAYATFEPSVSTSWRFRTAVDASVTNVDTGIVVAAGQFYDIDILVLPAQSTGGVGWAAMWVDGALMATSNTNIPEYAVAAGGELMAPFCGVLTGGGGKSVIIDLFESYVVGNESLAVDITPGF